jgi:hypothetical protein
MTRAFIIDIWVAEIVVFCILSYNYLNKLAFNKKQENGALGFIRPAGIVISRGL